MATQKTELLTKLREANQDFFSGQPTAPTEMDYDEAEDVLYISVGEPRLALTLNVGDGLMLRYEPETMKLVGFTVTSFQEHFIGLYPEFCFLAQLLAPPRQGSQNRYVQQLQAPRVAAFSRTTAQLVQQYMVA